VGAPPGYIGYEEGGQLTEAVRRRPYSVILLDEIEKAHTEVFNMLLQIMEDGHLSDAKGRRVDFRNTIIIMTSNVGAQLIKRATSLGFIPNRDEEKKVEDEYQSMRERVTADLKKTFRPEFLNRIDGVMVFRALTKPQITDIVDLEMKRVHWQLSEHNITLQVSEATKEFIVNIGYDPDYGARPLRRAIQNLLDDPLSEGVLAGRFGPGDCVLADYNPETKQIEFKVIASTPALPSVLDDLVIEQLLEPVLA
jgi:ATP-dependent Clp protease ATP-binding subunit ClpC